MAKTRTDVEILGASPLFAGIGEDELNRLGKLLRPVTLKASTPLFMQDDEPDGCYALFEGTVTVSVVTQRGEESLLAVLGEGDLVGEMGLIDDQPRSASIVALKPCRLGFLPRGEFQRFADQHPQIYRHMLALLAGRLRDTNASFTSQQTLSLAGRLAGVLLRLAKGFGEPLDGGERTLIRQVFTQDVLARMAGGARENVSRQINAWRRDGVLSKISRYYCIEDFERLEDEAKPLD
ncbi:MAG: Crp/Fnr family transcriptional regulator [Pseudomonadota bacterium]